MNRMKKLLYSFISRIPECFGFLASGFALAFLAISTPSMLPQTATASRDPTFEQKSSAARTDYFHGLEGDRDAEHQARQEFADLERDHPQDSEVIAYSGSLDLLESARTWAVWNKHALATDGLAKLDQAVSRTPDNLEVRFIRAATTWHLPFFFHRRDQAEQDFAFIAPRAEEAAHKGTLSHALAAAALSYYGEVLSERGDHNAARQAYEAAVRVDGTSAAGQEAKKRLKQ
jgi:hypothetical protein